MTIVFVTNIANRPHAILDSNEAVDMELIDGSPRVGCVIEKSGDRWKVIGNQVDMDCPGGVCPIK